MAHFIPTPAALENWGDNLAHACQCRSILHLCGELGVGKTTLVRGFLHALGYTGIVKSPTYTLIEPYQINERWIYHLDLYRLGDPEELEYLGIRDILENNVVCLIEWPEKGGALTPAPDVQIQLFHQTEGRLLELQAHSVTGHKIVSQVC